MMFRHSPSFLTVCTIWLATVSTSSNSQVTSRPSSSAAAPVPQASVSQATDRSPLAKAEHLYRTGKLAEAAQEYNALLQTEPRNALACVGLVHVYLMQKKPAE